MEVGGDPSSACSTEGYAGMFFYSSSSYSFPSAPNSIPKSYPLCNPGNYLPDYIFTLSGFKEMGIPNTILARYDLTQESNPAYRVLSGTNQGSSVNGYQSTKKL